ncbi:uncharacterized protein [Neodiprion pinetum]|uniref:uncharacterized protein n=1 Tax=Neodiprion pinetum TaxID=441929 RepID=UPI00371AF759
MKIQISTFIVLVVIAQCSLGLVQPITASGSSFDIDYCGIKADLETATRLSIEGIGHIFDLQGDILARLIDENGILSQHVSNEIRVAKNKTLTAFDSAYLIVSNTIAGTQPAASSANTNIRYVVDYYSMMEVDHIFASIYLIINTSNQCSDSYSEVLAKLGDNLHASISATYTVIEKLFMKIQGVQKYESQIEALFKEIQLSVISENTIGKEFIFSGMEILAKAAFGINPENQGRCCTLEEYRNRTIATVRKRMNLIHTAIKLKSLALSGSGVDLFGHFSVIDSGQEMATAAAQTVTVSITNAAISKINKAASEYISASESESCNINIAKDETYDNFKDFSHVVLRMATITDSGTSSSAMTSSFMIDFALKKLVSNFFDAVKSSGEIETFHNSIPSTARNIVQAVFTAIQNGQKYSDEIQTVIDESRVNATSQFETLLIGMDQVLELVVEASTVTNVNYAKLSAQIIIARSDLSSAFQSVIEHFFNAIRLLLVNKNSPDRSKITSIILIQNNETKASFDFRDAFTMIFEIIETFLAKIIITNQNGSKYYLPTNYSIAAPEVNLTEIINKLISASNLMMDTFLTINPGASATAETARSAMNYHFTNVIEVIYQSTLLVYCQNCAGILAEVRDFQEQATSNFTAAMKHMFNAFGQKNNTQLGSMIYEYRKRTVETIVAAFDSVCSVIRDVINQAYPLTRMENDLISTRITAAKKRTYNLMKTRINQQRDADIECDTDSAEIEAVNKSGTSMEAIFAAISYLIPPRENGRESEDNESSINTMQIRAISDMNIVIGRSYDVIERMYTNKMLKQEGNTDKCPCKIQS